MEHRDRATGWQHAKRSGHENEFLVKRLLDTDKYYAQNFLSRLGISNDTITETTIGGLHETKTTSVVGGRRNAKTDLQIFTDKRHRINISVKKSLGGQVYLVGASNFIDIFEHQFNKVISQSVKYAIKLFWSENEEAIDIIRDYANSYVERTYNLQLKHKSPNAQTLKAYNPNMYDDMLKWFSENMYEITKLSFAMGAAENSDEWADFLWYKNMFNENSVDALFYIEDICRVSQFAADDMVYFGRKNGGTTIQLPFGSVQWHQEKLEFRHSYNKIRKLVKSL